MLIGLGLNFIGVNPIKALVFATVFKRRRGGPAAGCRAACSC